MVHAKLLPSLAYGSELMFCREAKQLNQLVAMIYKKLFRLPRFSSEAQIRLEFGLVDQTLDRAGAILKLSHRLQRSTEGSLASLYWNKMNNSSPAWKKISKFSSDHIKNGPSLVFGH